MRITSIALANLRRRKGKALLLSTGIAIGVGTVVALLCLSASLQQEVAEQLDRFGANILVVPQANSLALDYGGVSVPGVSFDTHQLKNEDIQRIREIQYHDRLAVIAPKIFSVVQIENRQGLLAGVDFQQEIKLHRWWQIVGRAPEQEHDVLMGYEAARALSLISVPPSSMPQPVEHSGPHAGNSAPGFTLGRDQVIINGQLHRLTGVLAPAGGPEDRMVFGSLFHVQKLAGKPGQLNAIEVSALCKGCPVEDIVAQIGAKLPHARVSAVQQAVKARTELVHRLTRFSVVLGIVVLIIGSLMIFTTMMGAVVERTKEIGVLRAIGFRRSHILNGLMLEVAVVSALGGWLGWLLGVAASWLALPYFSEGGTGREFHPWLLVSAICAALLIGILSSAYPALRASKLDPSEAVRYI
jgi:putative ABC transport system permease protein